MPHQEPFAADRYEARTVKEHRDGEPRDRQRKGPIKAALAARLAEQDRRAEREQSAAQRLGCDDRQIEVSCCTGTEWIARHRWVESGKTVSIPVTCCTKVQLSR